MHIDYKTSIWNRIHLIDDVQKEDVLNYLKENPKANSEELFDKFGAENEILFDTEERLSLEDNSGEDTIEFYSTDAEQLWNNKEGEIK